MSKFIPLFYNCVVEKYILKLNLQICQTSHNIEFIKLHRIVYSKFHIMLFFLFKIIINCFCWCVDYEKNRTISTQDCVYRKGRRAQMNIVYV